MLIDYTEIDTNIVDLVKVLNEFPGVITTGSCGGHSNPGPGQNPAGEFSVAFKVEHTEHGQLSLEFLVWAVNNSLVRTGHNVRIYPYCAPPYLNDPGHTLYFVLEGADADPGTIAKHLRDMRQDFFMTPNENAQAQASLC